MGNRLLVVLQDAGCLHCRCHARKPVALGLLGAMEWNLELGRSPQPSNIRLDVRLSQLWDRIAELIDFRKYAQELPIGGDGRIQSYARPCLASCTVQEMPATFWLMLVDLLICRKLFALTAPASHMRSTTKVATMSRHHDCKLLSAKGCHTKTRARKYVRITTTPTATWHLLARP